MICNQARLFSRGTFATLMVLSILVAAPAWAVTIDTVPVGNLGNANDPSDGDFSTSGVQNFGAVAYEYRIGTTEVTNAQYADFLNAKAASDPLSLYNTSMGSNARGGITRSGVSGSFTYTTKTDMGNKPVNYVSWYDSIRFANWMHNNQGTGDTESGAYTLLGGTATPSNGLSITRNVGVATWWIPSENEWYKAAYHQPTAQGGDADNYWLYPTASNSAPTVATANGIGDISNPGTNVANYLAGADWNSQNGNVTTVGSAGPLSESYYGTSDQGGNVWEWNEALISGSFRSVRSGSFYDNIDAFYLRSSSRFIGNPTSEIDDFGFRVAATDGLTITGSDVSTTVDGGSTLIGGVSAVFDNVTGVGALTSDFVTPASFAEAVTNLGLLSGDFVGFLLAGTLPQYWELGFTGTFTGSVTVTLNYDPVRLGDVNLSTLQVYHGDNGTWSAVSNLVVNPLNHTISFTTDSFSPFVLGVPVPEPSTLLSAILGSLALLTTPRLRKSLNRQTA